MLKHPLILFQFGTKLNNNYNICKYFDKNFI